MSTRFHELPLLVLIAIFFASPAGAQIGTITTRWNTPSTLTIDQAAAVLAREARGETVSAADLFEARKHLRTDRTPSFAGTVAQKVATNLLSANLGPEVRLRTLPAVMMWLDPDELRDSSGKEYVRLRGEALTLSVMNADPNLAATSLLHFTFHEDWKFCGSVLCKTAAPGSVRDTIGYDLAEPLQTTTPGEAVSSELILATSYGGIVHSQTYPTTDGSRYVGAACDPLPSRTDVLELPARIRYLHTASRTEGQKNNRVFCGFFALPSSASSRFTYTIAGATATAPAGGSAAAVVNNPLSFALYQ